MTRKLVPLSSGRGYRLERPRRSVSFLRSVRFPSLRRSLARAGRIATILT
ncbi:MAG TPA: hypothetical protein VKV73_00620 [Chloroflexota bacterium]|nr:hypothetical protein [Chloroflexota bacterium]